MTTHRIPLPLETALRLQIAHLEYEKAMLHARNLQQTHDMLLREAEHTWQDTEGKLLAAILAEVPVAPAQCTFDLEQACLLYEVPDAPQMPQQYVEAAVIDTRDLIP